MKKYTLITGASSGIGLALAKTFAERKHNLLIIARREEILQQTASELMDSFDIDVICYKCDLCNELDIKNLLGFINDEGVIIENLINNAGKGGFGLFENSTLKLNEELIDINIKSVVNLTRGIIPQLIQNGEGRILNVSSMAAFLPGPFISVYAAAKSFILSYSVSLYAELKKHNIQVSVLCPPDIKTGFQEHAGLKGFNPPGELTLEKLAKITYDEFMIKKSLEIIPKEARKHIENSSRVNNKSILSQNFYRFREMLSNKLGLN